MKLQDAISSSQIPEKQKVLDYLKAFDADSATGMKLIDEVYGNTIDIQVAEKDGLDFR